MRVGMWHLCGGEAGICWEGVSDMRGHARRMGTRTRHAHSAGQWRAGTRRATPQRAGSPHKALAISIGHAMAAPNAMAQDRPIIRHACRHAVRHACGTCVGPHAVGHRALDLRPSSSRIRTRRNTVMHGDAWRCMAMHRGEPPARSLQRQAMALQPRSFQSCRQLCQSDRTGASWHEWTLHTRPATSRWALVETDSTQMQLAHR